MLVVPEASSDAVALLVYMGSGKEIETADGNPPLIDVLGAALNTRLLQASHSASAGQAAAPAAVAATTV